MTEQDVVEAMAEAWHQWDKEGTLPFTPDCCINGTKVAIEALGQFGIDSLATSVRFAFFNRFAWDLFQRGIPVPEWPDHAHSLGVGPKQDTAPNKWNGHLIAEGDGWALDISAGQFARPGRLIVEGPRVLPELPTNEPLLATDRHGQVLWMDRWPENVAWKTASGWRRSHTAEVNELVARIQRAMSIEGPSPGRRRRAE